MLKNNCSIFAIGNFDGIHKGHQELLKILKEVAVNEPYGVITFEPHPVVFFKKFSNYLITKTADKINLLKNYGVAETVVLPFNEIYQFTPQDFVEKILVNQLKVKTIVTGNNFTFGAKQLGNVALLTELAKKYNIQHIIVPFAKNPQGQVYSSSAVRKSISLGDCENVYKLLGRNYRVSGIVVEGNKLARILDFPTANIKLQDYISPKYGVYAVYAIIDEVKLEGIANFGIRPTLADHQEFLEVHIFNYNKNIYDKLIKVEFLKFIRNEMKFPSIDLLKQQIIKDVTTVKEYFTSIKLNSNIS